MKSLKESVDELNQLVSQFKFHEALNIFYDENIITCENESPPTIGLPAYREAATKYLSNISNASAELMNVIISDNMSVCEWHFKFDHNEWGHFDAVQLSLQRWKKGKIVHERHHHRIE
jgi:hypothetical protein